MANSLRLVGAMIPFIFGAFGFSFIIAAFASRDWVHQDYFPHKLQPLDWKDPIYTIYRSPFILCDVKATKPDSNTTVYELNCHRFKVWGRGQTSCQAPNETNAYSSITGDVRMCQQVHFSGNLILASLVFVTIAFAIILPLSYVFLASAVAVEEREAEQEAENGLKESPTPTGATKRTKSRHTRPKQKISSPAIATATYSLLFALAIAAMCALLSQFYGVLGLVQSQPDQGTWASLSMGEIQDNQLGTDSHAPWVQGNALTVYASLGWLFSALAAGAIGANWLKQIGTLA